MSTEYGSKELWPNLKYTYENISKSVRSIHFIIHSYNNRFYENVIEKKSKLSHEKHSLKQFERSRKFNYEVKTQVWIVFMKQVLGYYTRKSKANFLYEPNNILFH